MESTTLHVRIEPLVIPASLDAPDATDFLEGVRIANDAWRRASGTDLHDDEPAELLVRSRETPYRVTHLVGARVEGRLVGIGSVEFDKTTADSAEFDVSLVAEHEQGPAADALLAEVERIARERGRSVLQTWTIHRPDPVERRLVPPTGAGWIPSEDAATRRMLAAGFRLGQVERNSVFELHGSYDATDVLLEQALAKAGPDYRTVWWAGPTPPEYAAGYAAAIARMHSDVPSGDMVTEQSVWDAERVFERDGRFAEAGTLMGVTLVLHEPTGAVAAFNELSIGPDRTRPTSQWGTLVMPEHRGRRLGAIVKCIGLKKWHELVPESPRVSTFNAEENRYMLDVNEAVGFVPASYAGAWEKKLS
ncbi:GNAT family N-acetyltransferase [Microbacterium sp. JZ31]|uniref:GNAT family N-acetyltransferase n=1 Tax=Microbacterium sp. JZ31 TaxID=1906274 RepID=UPI00193375FE|nr:GNAT family N-acetyltransferase [Microbacterium sp. JZ31]